MKKSKMFITRVIAVILVAVSVLTMTSVGSVGATGAVGSIVQNSTFASLLEAGISSGAKLGVTTALTPMISIIGQELFGLPADTGLTEIKERLEKIDGQLDQIRAELTEGFKKVLEELEKNEQMGNTIDSLAQAEFLADLIMNTGGTYLPATIEEAEKLSGEEQRRIIEINADNIKAETVNELYNELQKAKAYLAKGGYIDSNYNTAYVVYYNYMKKQSMFCGEAAMKSECFWEVMKESYAKSCIALIYALEQQLAMYELYEAEATDAIKQEAIDAAAVAETFGTKNVIENKLAKVKADAQEVLDYYDEFLAKAEEEATVFINKDTCYIELAAELGSISFDNCADFAQYTENEGFEKGGITKELYERTLRDVRYYYYNAGNNHIDADTVSFEEFITNTGICTRLDTYRDVYGFYDIPKEVNWDSHSKHIFKDMLLNLKVTKHNVDNRPDDDVTNTIISYVKENYTTMSIAEYLESVGFSFGGRDISNQTNFYMPTANFTTGNGSADIKCKGKIYELTTQEKAEAGSFENCIGADEPAGTIFYFRNAEDTIEIEIVSDEMDGRIYNGTYTINAKEIVGYNADGTAIYELYKAVYEVEGNDIVNFRLPVSLDYKTIKVTLGYEGLGASSNHENLCTFSLADCDEIPEKLTLEMEGYTKIWLGYGVHARILCDGVSVATGEG